jgi:hypothetical protein
VFHPSDYAGLVVSSTAALTAGGATRGQRWRVNQNGDRIAVMKVEGLQGGPVPDGKQRNLLDLRVLRVPDGEVLDRLTWRRDQARDAIHPVDACTFDFAELAIAVDGEVRVLEFPSGEERYRFGKDVTALLQHGAHRIAATATAASRAGMASASNGAPRASVSRSGGCRRAGTASSPAGRRWPSRASRPASAGSATSPRRRRMRRGSGRSCATPTGSRSTRTASAGRNGAARTPGAGTTTARSTGATCRSC